MIKRISRPLHLSEVLRVRDPKSVMHLAFLFYTGFFPATSRGAAQPHKIQVGYSGWEKCIHPSC
ncbi:hypothetical protein C0557_15075 [Kosakonia sp. MUSA4]|nr:hypothetical protein C0557_15075 [Kosakonia sp. MUSA4]